jgi:uncharacterized protein (TIGR03000 family)
VLVVHLPANAELQVGSSKVVGSGTQRQFRSPPIEVGKNFSYVFKATWKEGDQVREIEKKVMLRAGQKIEVDLYPDDGLTAEERSVLQLANAQRAKVGASPLRPDHQLTQAARGHSANMARQSVLNHTLDGATFDKRITATGYQPGEAGENIAEGARTPAEVMQMWMNSEGHRVNILNPRYQEIGIGVASSGSGRRYWTQVFATPLGTSATP